MRRTILLLSVAALLLASVDAGAEGIRPSSDTATASRQHERTITAELSMGYGYTKGVLFVGGRLHGPDGRACGRGQPVRFQRLVSDRWLTQRGTRTGRDGWIRHANGFMMGVGRDEHPAGSEWRVVAPESTLPNGDVCLRAVSPVMEHRRPS